MGCLDRFQLAIHADDGKTPSKSNLVESYTMAFTYGEDVGMQMSRKVAGGDGSGGMELAVAKRELSQLHNLVVKELEALSGSPYNCLYLRGGFRDADVEIGYRRRWFWRHGARRREA